jgi:hypothetical protein
MTADLIARLRAGTVTPADLDAAADALGIIDSAAVDGEVLPPEIASEVQKHTGAPWWNGRAYCFFKGYPGRIAALEAATGHAIDDIADVIEWLRSEKMFVQSDRLRTIAGRLARARGDPWATPPEADADAWLNIAKKWK